MDATFPVALAETLSHEGGWSDHPRDPGGATMMGITLATYRAWTKNPAATKAQLRAITRGEVEAIYRKGYWEKVAGPVLPVGVDAVVFDAGVNSGPQRALGWYQATRVPNQPLATVKAFSARRRGFLQSLKTFDVFGKGWMRRVASVEALGIRLAMGAAGKTRVEQNAELKTEAASSKAASKAQTRTAGGAATGAGGAVALPQVTEIHQLAGPWAVVAAFVAGALLAAAVAVLIHRARAQAARAAVFLEQANG